MAAVVFTKSQVRAVWNAVLWLDNNYNGKCFINMQGIQKGELKKINS